jgi:hypothetical protein
MPKNDFLQVLLNPKKLLGSLAGFAYSEAGQRHFGIFSQNNSLPRRNTSSFSKE